MKITNTLSLWTAITLASAPVLANEFELPVTPVEMMSKDFKKTELMSIDDAIPQEKSVVNYEASTDNPQPFVFEPQVDASTQVVQQMPHRKALPPKPVVELSVGESDKAPIAIDVMNRIRTPFENVMVKSTAANTEIMTEGSDIYILTTIAQPIGLFIREEGVPATTVGITLLPQQGMLQQQIKLDVKWDQELDLKVMAARAEVDRRKQQSDQNKPQLLETSEYEKSIKYLMRGLALQEVPRGFSLEDPEIFEQSEYADQSATPCTQNLLQKVGQRMVSGKQIIDIVLVQNPLDRPQSVRQELCYKEGVIAVGAYPKSELAPGEKTELYILRSKETFKKRRKTRRSLLEAS